jgi:hypothetical protein
MAESVNISGGVKAHAFPASAFDRLFGPISGLSLPEMRPPSRLENRDATVTCPDRFREIYNDLRGSMVVTGFALTI